MAMTTTEAATWRKKIERAGKSDDGLRKIASALRRRADDPTVRGLLDTVAMLRVAIGGAPPPPMVRKRRQELQRLIEKASGPDDPSLVGLFREIQSDTRLHAFYRDRMGAVIRRDRVGAFGWNDGEFTLEKDKP